MTKEELWEASLARIQLTISSANFSTWFRETSIFSIEKGEVIISVPNNFSKEWLQNKYNNLILKCLREIDNSIKKIEYKVVPNKTSKTKEETVVSLPEDQLRFADIQLNKETNLNPRYQFDNFVVGSFNELAHAAALAVSRKPGHIYNPLFIYGEVGLGKTHLIQATGNRIHQNFKNKKIQYTSSEKFTSRIIRSIQDHSIEKMKSFYKNVDVLIIDDIQFLAGKEKTQEEFFHIFNSLYEKNKQIIISSDRPPKAISALEERLRSRFEGGMIADISLPEFETRIAILREKCKEKKISLPEDIIEYIASNIQSNIRELEGALNKIIAHQNISHQKIDLEGAKKILDKTFFAPRKRISPQKIIKTVAEFYNLTDKEILDPSRKKEIVKPRQVAMFFLREELKSSFPFIGKKFGGKDHTTAMYSYQKIKDEIKKDQNLSEELKMIKKRFYVG